MYNADVCIAPRLRVLGKPVPLYPPTSSPLIVPSTKTSHRQALEAVSRPLSIVVDRSINNAQSKLLRTFYPDASLSFNVLRSQFAKDDRDLAKDLFDPLQGNKLSISRVPTVDSNEENRDELDVLAFPTGELGEDLSASTTFELEISSPSKLYSQTCLRFVVIAPMNVCSSCQTRYLSSSFIIPYSRLRPMPAVSRVESF